MRHGAGRPFVTVKLAVSADGMIGRKGRGNVAITGETARDWTHLQRARSEAILIGASTARLDDPQLTVRLPGLESRSPLRVIPVGAKGIDRKVNLVDRFSAHRLAIIAETDSPVDAPPSVEVLRVEGKRAARTSPRRSLLSPAKAFRTCWSNPAPASTRPCSMPASSTVSLF
ncbi:RibD family protein [Devosia sp. A8/3-2]|nr:RibD family protein [Devosia sp. A8/3-2]